MTSEYENTRKEIINKINFQKTIYKFRTLIYSLNKDIRHLCFSMSRDFLINELNNITLSSSEKNRLDLLITHWQVGDFENNSTNWWSVLSHNHSKSITLSILMHLWIDDMTSFDLDQFETSSLGLS